ncbi:MAG: AsmA-like C-terminal region-containing protein [Brumimicrobium sp.]|nr:AsmA-like C-terminal region-containing protein [Brumimicrobium sp.]
MSARKSKKKKSVLKRILKWTGITFGLLIIALILIPIFFKDELKELALKEANKMLKADVALGDFDLTFISTFPDMTLVFDDVSITGRNEFKGVKLIDMKRFETELGFWSVINMEDIEVRSIRLIEPKIDVRVLENGVANYDIVKSEEEIEQETKEPVEETPFKLTLQHYEIVNGDIKYTDKMSNMYADIVKLNHKGTGDMTADVIDFKTTTSMDALTYEMDGISYLSEVKTDLLMNLLMEFKEGSDKFTLKENELTLNALKLSFDGFYEMLDGYENMDISLKADQTSFKDLLSLVPVLYHTGYESMVAKGNMSIKGFVKGRMDAVNLPAWDFSTVINGASIAYPDMPAKINNIAVHASSTFPGGEQLDNMTVDVSKFHADFVGNTIDADFSLRNPMSDPYMKSSLIANIDLASLEKVIPLSEGEKYNGKLNSDLKIDGRLSTLEKEEYEKFNATGSLRLAEMIYESRDLPDAVNIKDMLFEFSPQKLNLANLEGKMGKTDFKMNGDVENYMGYVFRDEPLKGTFTHYSSFLDLDLFMPAEATAEPVAEGAAESPSADQAASSEEETVTIPANIDFVLNSKIDKMIYDGMPISNMQGTIILRDQQAILENLNMNALEGSVGLSGKYNTQDPKNPKVDFSYSLKEIDIKQLADNFITVEKLAPIAKYATGKISSDFKMTTQITPSFEPIYNSLNGAGTFSTKEVVVAGYKPLEKLAEVTKIDKLKKQTVDNVRASFTFENGRINVKPFQVKLGNIGTEVSGSTSFEQDIDYALKMNIPKEEIPKEILGIAEKAIEQAKKIPGFKMKELPATIPVTALITNKVTDPVVKTNMKEKIMELGGDIKGGVQDLIDEKTQQLKDTLNEIKDQKIDEAKAELEKRKQKIIADAQAEADKVKAEGKKLADKTRKEGDQQAQKIIDEAGNNPLKKKTAEIAAEKVRKEAEESAQKIERESQQKADKIMAEARKKADSLE